MVKRLSSVDQNNRPITNVPTPTSGGDAVNKTYADTKAPLSHTHPVSDLTATGTRDATTFLRGDNTWATIPSGGMTNPMTATGDIIIGGTSGAPTRLAGNTSTARQFLTSVGSGSAATAPSWTALTKTDVGLSAVDNTSDATKNSATATITNKNLADATNTVSFRRVIHGATASTARPNATHVEWVGSVAPTNANTSLDTWIDTA